MKKAIPTKYRLLTVLCLAVGSAFFLGGKPAPAVVNSTASDRDSGIKIDTPTVYQTLKLAELGLSEAAFNYGMSGYEKLLAAHKITHPGIISIIDFSMHSTKKRMFVIDLLQKKLLFHTLVSHGRNSGIGMATSFSNEPESFKSSPGFYITADIYNGKHESSLRLLGIEKGINDNALSRGIVMHAAAYVSETFAKRQGYLGRSQGCPALPETLCKNIIQKICNGSCLFIYSPEKQYISQSAFIKRTAG